MTKPIAHSFTAITDYENCPRMYYLKRVAKLVKDPPSEHSEWGNRVHNAIDKRIKEKTPLPTGMEQWEPLVAKLDNQPGRVFSEQKIALTRNHTPTTWFAKDVWMRVIIDAGVDFGKRATLIDWKTGKIKHDIAQLRLFSGVWMSLNAAVERVRTAFVWLPDKKTTREDFTRDDLPTIWEEINQKTRRIEVSAEQNRWLPKPSGLCRGWCPAGKQHCEFWSPRKT